jgi:hypothetical protein
MKALKIISIILFSVFMTSVASANSYSTEPKVNSITSEYKNKLASLILLSRTSVWTTWFAKPQFLTAVEFGLSQDKEAQSEAFADKYLESLECQHLTDITDKSLSDFDDVCEFHGSRSVFVNLKDGVPSNILIRDSED